MRDEIALLIIKHLSKRLPYTSFYFNANHYLILNIEQNRTKIIEINNLTKKYILPLIVDIVLDLSNPNFFNQLDDIVLTLLNNPSITPDS